MLASPRDLDTWFRESGLTDREPGSRAEDLGRAIAVREAVYDLVRGRIVGKRDDPRSVSVLNAAAALPPVIPQISAGRRVVKATPAQALSSVAREAIEVLGSPAADLLRECGRPECTQVYLDESRGPRREWCAMGTCGNRMKAAAYRARQRGEAAPEPERIGA